MFAKLSSYLHETIEYYDTIKTFKFYFEAFTKILLANADKIIKEINENDNLMKTKLKFIKDK